MKTKIKTYPLISQLQIITMFGFVVSIIFIMASAFTNDYFKIPILIFNCISWFICNVKLERLLGI